MSPEVFIHRFGYAGLAVGTFFEGEVILSAGGYLARQGLLRLPWVIGAGFLGTLASDQLCFFVGRKFGRRLLRRFPRLKGKVDIALRTVRRHKRRVIVGFQFLPGSCTVIPFSFGLSQVSAASFLTLDVVGAGLWSIVFSGIGYVFGMAAGLVIRDVHRLQLGALAALATAIVAGVTLKNRLASEAAPQRPRPQDDLSEFKT